MRPARPKEEQILVWCGVVAQLYRTRTNRILRDVELPYPLFVLLRQRLVNPKLAVAQVETLRIRLIKVAARVVESVRRVKFSLPTQYPWIDDWLDAASAAGGVV